MIRQIISLTEWERPRTPITAHLDDAPRHPQVLVELGSSITLALDVAMAHALRAALGNALGDGPDALTEGIRDAIRLGYEGESIAGIELLTERFGDIAATV